MWISLAIPISFSVLEFHGPMSLMSAEFPYIGSFPRLSLFLIGPGQTHYSGLLQNSFRLGDDRRVNVLLLSTPSL